MNASPVIARVRHELRRRRLTVARVETRPAGMKRIVLRGDDLAGFTSSGFDDHVKLFFPDGAGGQLMRDFTPRRYDPARGELWIDFFLHGTGPAASWARDAGIGVKLEVGGPKGSTLIDANSIDTHLLIGDETALPAIERRLEELNPGARAIVVIELDAASRLPAFVSDAALEVAYLRRERHAAQPSRALLSTVRNLRLPPSGCFAWVAHEGQMARAIRACLHEEKGLDEKWIKASAYWWRGLGGADTGQLPANVA